tara:strand:- start:1221 stop:1676 length:456 start_codon:yes stop_codon:yes gene_type:complete
MSECQINIDLSDVIAILAALVAGLSALYARWAWREAKRANEILLSGHKKEIYDAFFELKMHMQQKAEFAELSEVSKFYYPSRNAQLYLSKSLAEKISKYYEACFWVADIHHSRSGYDGESMERCKPHIDTEQKLAPEIDKAISELIRSANA